MILDLLEGKDKISSEKLAELKTKIGEKPNLLWYPACGSDYRDIYETTRRNMRFYLDGFNTPDLYIHTDFHESGVFDGEDLVYEKNIKNKGFTNHPDILRIKILSKHELKLKDDYKPNIVFNREYAHIFNNNPQLNIYLLEIEITIMGNEHITKPVLFFIVENINFFEEILLKYKIQISGIVKVREGLGFGGCGKSIINVFPFLSNLGTKYIITDDEEQFDKNLSAEIARRNNITAKKQTMNEIGHLEKWSDFDQIQIYEINYTNENINIDELRYYRFRRW